MSRTCGTKPTSTGQRLLDIDYWVATPYCLPGRDWTLQRKNSCLKNGKHHSVNIIERKVYLTYPKVNFVPAPVVWSAEGPVLLLGVEPDPSSHSYLSLLSLFVDQWGQDPTKSTSQSSGPINRKIYQCIRQWNSYLYSKETVILVKERIIKRQTNNDLKWFSESIFSFNRSYLLCSAPIYVISWEVTSRFFACCCSDAWE